MSEAGAGPLHQPHEPFRDVAFAICALRCRLDDASLAASQFSGNR